MDAAAGMLVQSSPTYTITKKSSFTLELRVTVQSYLTVLSPADSNISAVMSLRKSSYVPPRGVTATSAEADRGWEAWSGYHDFALQATHKVSARDRYERDRPKRS